MTFDEMYSDDSQIFTLGVTFDVLLGMSVYFTVSADELRIRLPPQIPDSAILEGIVSSLPREHRWTTIRSETLARFAKSFTDHDLETSVDNRFQTTFALELLVWPCVGLNKISVLLFYKRIFVTPAFRKVVWCLIGVCIAWTIAFEFALLCESSRGFCKMMILITGSVSCTIISSNWNPKTEHHCVDQITLFTVALATDVVTDGKWISSTARWPWSDKQHGF